MHMFIDITIFCIILLQLCEQNEVTVATLTVLINQSHHK